MVAGISIYSNSSQFNSRLFFTSVSATKVEFAPAIADKAPTYPINYILVGQLTEGKKLKEPLTVLIDYDEGEYLVSEPEYHIHAAGGTKKEAIANFRRILAGTQDILEADKGCLSPRLQRELNFLNSIIVPL